MENWNGRHGELDIRRLGPLQTTEFLMLGGLFWTGCVSDPACGKATGSVLVFARELLALAFRCFHSPSLGVPEYLACFTTVSIRNSQAKMSRVTVVFSDLPG